MVHSTMVTGGAVLLTSSALKQCSPSAERREGSARHFGLHVSTSASSEASCLRRTGSAGSLRLSRVRALSVRGRFEPIRDSAAVARRHTERIVRVVLGFCHDNNNTD